MNSARTPGPIVGVTLATADLDATEAAYSRHLGYRVAERGVVSESTANAWGCSGAAGSRYVIARPAIGDDFHFRFVEAAHAAGYRAFSCFGWNAAELIVRDVDAMATRLENTPFQILGPPQDLSFTDAIRAMQVRGPAGEILYLTQFKREIPSLPAPPARCAVDRVFIVIVGGPSLDELLDFYVGEFGLAEPQRMQSRVKAMSEVFRLSPEHRYDIAALPLRSQCYIEADQMPEAARAPVLAGGQLPPGIASVAFRLDHLPARCLRGPAGELIELV
jgi:catechol 2,3-dioxygenase-like lactoylglutathione lyase family enzyme